MFKKVLILLLISVTIVSAAKYHTDARSAEIHTPFRWIVADSTARMALSVAAADTQKFCFQLADTTIWCLIDNSPKNWTWVSGKKADSLKVRSLNADSATIPIFKGNETHRDSAYFAGGLRGLRLYTPVLDADSMVGDVKIGGNVAITHTNTTAAALSINNSAGNMTGLTLKSGGVIAGYLWSFDDTVMQIGDGTNEGSIAFNNSKIGVGKVNPTTTLDVNGTTTTTTLNTGNGDNELYPMNQDVRSTASPTFVSVTSNLTGNVTGNVSGSSGSCTGNAATATNGVVTTGSYADPAWITSLNGFKVCDTGSFACTLKTSDVTVQQIGTAYYQKIGNLFICSFPRLIGISNSNTLVMYCTIPYYPKQVYAINTNYSTAYVMDNNASSIQLCYPSSTANGVVFTVSGSSSGFTSSNNKGVTGPFTMTYVADY